MLDNTLMPTAFRSKKQFQANDKKCVKRVDEYNNDNDAKFIVEAWRKEIQNTFKIVWATIGYKFYT